MPRKRAEAPDTSSFGPEMKWSPEARARRSEAAKKAAATRKAKRDAKLADFQAQARTQSPYPYYQGSRLARLLCRYASPLVLFIATARVRLDEDGVFLRRVGFRPTKYVLAPSRKKRPFRFA